MMARVLTRSRRLSSLFRSVAQRRRRRVRRSDQGPRRPAGPRQLRRPPPRPRRHKAAVVTDARTQPWPRPPPARAANRLSSIRRTTRSDRRRPATTVWRNAELSRDRVPVRPDEKSRWRSSTISKSPEKTGTSQGGVARSLIASNYIETLKSLCRARDSQPKSGGLHVRMPGLFDSRTQCHRARHDQRAQGLNSLRQGQLSDPPRPERCDRLQVQRRHQRKEQRQLHRPAGRVIIVSEDFNAPRAHVPASDERCSCARLRSSGARLMAAVTFTAVMCRRWRSRLL